VTDLSGQDLWALVQDGWEPCGFLFEFCKFHGWHVTSGPSGGGELTSANDVVETARKIACDRMLAQAKARPSSSSGATSPSTCARSRAATAAASSTISTST
jgi:hypothetical protein